MRVLGIHDGHNASLCLVEDGQIRFAIQEERLVNKKNQPGFPKESLRFLFSRLKLSPKEIDKVAVASLHSSHEFSTGQYFEKHKKSSWQRKVEWVGMKTPVYAYYKARRKQQRIKEITSFGFTESQITFVDHHLCHAATAYFGSHFPRQEKILVLTNDGAGDGLCATISVGQYNKLQKLSEVSSDHSLAGVYCLITKMMGFKPLEHEYKLMGMAPYCSPAGEEQGYTLFKDLISVSSEDPFQFKKNIPEPITLIMPHLQKGAKFMRFDNLCAGLQKFTEDILVGWVKGCITKTGIRKIALAGGIFMNVKANKKIMELDEVEDLFVFPSCSDETISIGAAYYASSQLGQEISPLDHFYLGNNISNKEVLEEINRFEGLFDFKFRLVDDIEKEVAHLVAGKKVVARCKGRMEFGARALGNRSILADPFNLECIREINLMVKKRDFWMPFAPVILKERADDYIVNPKKVSAPYMILSFDTTKNFKELIAAVHQADLTARPQVIDEAMNKEYYQILKEFERITGRGVLLNTSFNLHGLPIVYGPKEALEVFRDSGLHYLALGDYLLEK